MTFTKLSEENKQLINNYKEQYGNENVGSYRALLMRGKSSSDAINIINSRKEIKPIETKKAEVQPMTPQEKPQPKRQAKKQKVEAVKPLAIENTKAPEPAPAPKAKAKATRKKKNEDTTVELIL